MRAGLEGLELVHGLLGLGSAQGSGSGRGSGFDPRIESGRRIAGYRVVRELGRGGMGTVYEAVHMGLGRPVALKVLGIHAAPDTSARRRFLNEARMAAGLHHTHIVPVFDVGQVGGLCYYAMQRIEGSGLDRVVRYLRRSRPSIAGGGGGPASGRFAAHESTPGGSRPFIAQCPARTSLGTRLLAMDAGSGVRSATALGRIKILTPSPRLARHFLRRRREPSTTWPRGLGYGDSTAYVESRQPANAC